MRAVGRIGYPDELLDRLGRIYLSRSYLPALRRAAAEGSEQVRRFAQIAIERIEAGGRDKEMNSR